MSYSQDLRERVVAFVKKGGSKSEAVRRFSVSRWCVIDWLKRETLEAQKTGPKTNQKIDIEKLKAHVEAHPDAYHRERAVELGVSSVWIGVLLKRLGYTRKKTMLYKERNDACRNVFCNFLEQIPFENQVYVDETGFEAPLHRVYGYKERGVLLWGERTGKRFARTSLIAGLKGGKVVAPMEFQGYCNREVVFAWVTQMLIPSLKAGDTVIWDNASFHKGSCFEEAFEKAGIRLLFLPPYSPDLNPIEQFWAQTKLKICSLFPTPVHISIALTEVFCKLVT